jgi:peptidyl-tRNA hydrolase, PTH1 family
LLAANHCVSLRKLWFNPIEIGYGTVDPVHSRFYLAKPLTYMNKSGEVLSRLLRRTRTTPSNLLVICDNLDLSPGRIRIRYGGSDAGHNGLKSVINFLGTSDFLRVYIGIGRPQAGMSIIDHVLGIPENPQLVNKGVKLASEAVIKLLKGEPEDKVKNEFNRKGS